MKENTFYFAHDYNARSDVKIKKLLMKFGMQGYGIYWCIVEDLYQNANALPLHYESIAFELRISPDIIERIINDFDLFVSDGINFGSLSVQRRLDERNSKSLKARESAFKRWNKSESNAIAMRMHSEGNAIKESKVKEKKVKESKINIPSNKFDVDSGNFDSNFQKSIKEDLKDVNNKSEGDMSKAKDNALEQSKTLKKQKESTQDASEFKKMLDLYDSFCKKNEMVIRITASDGKALKDIIAYLKEIPSVKNNEKDIYQTFDFILNNFSNLDKWMQTQTQLRQINSQLPNIINQIKNHYNGKKITNDNQSELQSLVNQIRNRMESE
jgi:hypothetical protein